MAEKPLSYSTDAATEFGDYYHMSFGPIPGLNVSDPLLIDGVLKTNSRACQKSIYMRSIFGTLIGYDNLLTGENAMHTRQRRLLMPVF